MATTLLLITANPDRPTAWHAYRYAKAFLETHHQSTVKDDISSDSSDAKSDESQLSLFFYADAAHTANRLRWQTADRSNLSQQWQQLSKQFKLTLPVCVSTALTRGVTDDDNAKRHQLDADNIATGFELVGLGQLAEKLTQADKVIQF